jgi:hypothetical protein
MCKNWKSIIQPYQIFLSLVSVNKVKNAMTYTSICKQQFIWKIHPPTSHWIQTASTPETAWYLWRWDSVSCPCWELNLNFLNMQPVVGHYTDHPIPASKVASNQMRHK